MMAKLMTDSAMSSHNTHSAPRSVKARNRSVMCMKAPFYVREEIRGEVYAARVGHATTGFALYRRASQNRRQGDQKVRRAAIIGGRGRRGAAAARRAWSSPS